MRFWQRTTFDVRTGCLLSGPASADVPTYEARRGRYRSTCARCARVGNPALLPLSEEQPLRPLDVIGHAGELREGAVQ
jgi:hypothetical protein